ncbi:site-2 protease family protein [Gammaproteobacteria bacterium AB-CW1]|uniref:Zinc metalloprotease n=1 Tax=Natronospira elongata TaxID=3110268 RepID=A0AAP6JGF3_9GAMM|nr:site-2 protease family protein [Gammaproteobacteria bacterium AB-CW1]
MFKTVLVLGHIHGIRLQVHISWLVIFALLMVTLTTTLQHHHPEWALITSLLTALFTALLFFASILAHEMGHSIVAIRRGVPVKSITLFIFGGMAQLGRDSDNPEDEFRIAIAGPLVSLALAVGFFLLSVLSNPFSEALSVAFGWLGAINLIVAVFNLIPGFPLDGGRVFRAAVWRFTGDARKGVRAAVMGGRVVAYGLFALGIWNGLFFGNLIGGLWIILIAWFLLFLAEGHGKHYDLRERLAGITAGDLAEHHVPSVDARTPVSEWISQRVVPEARRAYMITGGGDVLGLLTLSDIKHLPRERWDHTPVSQFMTPIDRLHHVAPESDPEEVLGIMTEHGLNQLPVVDEDRVTGWIDRQRLLQAIEIHLATQPTSRPSNRAPSA